MPPDVRKLRPPNELEWLLYKERLRALKEFFDAAWGDSTRLDEAPQMALRFKKDIFRYGFVLTTLGPMVQVEADALDAVLTAAQQARVADDMNVLIRLRTK